MKKDNLNYYKGNKNETRKWRNDLLYKNFLVIISLMLVFVLLVSIFFILEKGINGFFKFSDLNLKYFLFGNYYDGKTMFAAGFMVVNTIWVTFLAILISLPISIFTALFVTRVLPNNFRIIFLSIISILAAIPTVIYGAFGMSVIDKMVIAIFNSRPGVLLSVVLMLAFMIMPTITLLTISSISSVDKKMENSSLALGATRSQTSMLVTLKSAQPGIIVAVLLGVGRAMGEATAVSMVASQSNSGPSFWFFDNIRLLTSTMLTGWGEIAKGSIEEASIFAMAIILLITISLVFLSINYFKKITTPEYKSKKSSLKIELRNSIKKEYEKFGLQNLTKSNQKILTKELEINSYKEQIKKQNDFFYEVAISNRDYSIKNNTNSYKKRKSFINNFLLGSFSLFGILLLISILLFLFVDGSKVLTWDYLSSRTSEIIIINDQYITLYGLAIPIFGTLLTIATTLMIAFPIGLLMGIMLGVYLKKDTKFGSTISFFVELLTGIPALIYGIIASILFLPIANLIGVKSISGTLIMTIFVLPTIIKSTQNSLENIDKKQFEGSMGLGATKYITISKVLIKQSYNEIIYSLIISSGLIMADSAIFIILYGTSAASSSVDWILNGGTTLSTEIYKLTKLEEVPWEYVKAIGIVIVFFIISLSFFANLVRDKRTIESIIFGMGFLLVLLSILIAQYIIFVIGLVIMILFTSLIFIYVFMNNKYNLNTKVNNLKETLIYNLRK